MFQELQSGSGGSGGYSKIIFKLVHIVNATTITRSVNINGVDVSGIGNITATSQGNYFDDTVTFTASGKSISWRVYHTNGANPILYNEITIDGTTSYYNMFADKDLALNNNLTNPYDWELPLGV